MKRIYLSSPHMSGKEMKYINEAFATNWIAPLEKNVDEFEFSVLSFNGNKHKKIDNNKLSDICSNRQRIIYYSL